MIFLGYRRDGRFGGMHKDEDSVGFTEVQKLKIQTIG